ncbi:basic proline-rich protein-like [Gopherus flavomarginatus]|uniref:basic proline-rich protein-like n=1 Tax=Gopherus flavomarginatus TaxID=286002 RepID=UPI0021CB9EF5|nr:basic proline-rich protein-like [Gopherus flavomarginatus]
MGVPEPGLRLQGPGERQEPESASPAVPPTWPERRSPAGPRPSACRTPPGEEAPAPGRATLPRAPIHVSGSPGVLAGSAAPDAPGSPRSHVLTWGLKPAPAPPPAGSKREATRQPRTDRAALPTHRQRRVEPVSKAPGRAHLPSNIHRAEAAPALQETLRPRPAPPSARNPPGALPPPVTRLPPHPGSAERQKPTRGAAPTRDAAPATPRLRRAPETHPGRCPHP